MDLSVFLIRSIFQFFCGTVLALLYIDTIGFENGLDVGIFDFIWISLTFIGIAFVFFKLAYKNFMKFKELDNLRKKDINQYNAMIDKMNKDLLAKQKREEQAREKTQKKLQKQQKENERKEREIKEKVKRLKREGKVCCPKCGSESVSAGTRGYTITTGFIGSGSVRCICMNCGYKWKPGKSG